jgi:hypothetical protein
MKSRESLILSVIVILVATAHAVTSTGIQGYSTQARQKVTGTPRDTHDNPGPVVDYEANLKSSALKNAKVDTLRQIRSPRYNNRAPEPLREFASVEFALHTDWEIGLSPLPVAQSDVVILAKVVDAKAYLSDDRKGVYSEFTIRLEKVFKNTSSPLKEFIVAEREGGIVRFSSGRLLPYRIFRQRLPRPHRKYVFFLKQNSQGEDYHIITGYEIRNGRTSPLDEAEKFAVFNGFDKTEFLNLLEEAITEASQQ